MKRNRGHFTTTDPQHVRSRLKKPEQKLRDGSWIKVTADRVITGTSRSDVRAKAKAAA